MYPLPLKAKCHWVADVLLELVTCLLEVGVFIDILQVGAEGSPLGRFL